MADAPIPDKLTVANIKARYQSPIPDIFKSIQKILLTVGGIGAAIVAATAALPAIPAIIGMVASYFIVAGAVGAGMTTLTSVTPPNTIQSPNQNQP